MASHRPRVAPANERIEGLAKVTGLLVSLYIANENAVSVVGAYFASFLGIEE